MYCSKCGAAMAEKLVDGRLRYACAACGYVNYRQLKTGAGVLLEQDGALLLVQRGSEGAFPGVWNLPAGYCEADEPPPVTAARETAEETGLQVQVGRLVDVYYFDDDPRGNGLLLVYEAKAVGGELGSDGQEVVDVGFFPPEGLPKPLCGGGHDRAIEAWQARARDRWQPGLAMRYCPHCAHPLEERLAFDRMRCVCPACGFVNFREPKVGVSVLVEQERRILLVQRAIDPGKGLWSLPSGFVEWDESPETAAIRECAEETGLAVEILDLLDVRHYTDDYRGPGLNLTYSARVTEGFLRPGDDAQAVGWFAPAEIPAAERLAFGNHRFALERWQAAWRAGC